MNNVFWKKLFLKKTRIFFLFFVLGFVFFTFYYNQKNIQEKTSKFFLKKIRSHFGKRVSIKHATINFLKKELIFYDVKIRDHHHFPFIRLSKCKISINNLFYFLFINSEYLNIQNCFIEHSSFFIKKYYKEKDNNILFFIKNVLVNKKSNGIRKITCYKLVINPSSLTFNKINHVFFTHIKNIIINNKKIKATICSFQDKKNKNFLIKNLCCDLIYYYFSKVEFYHCSIQTSHSYLKGSFTFYDKKNKNYLFEKEIQCKILKGSVLGSDLGTLIFNKWSFKSFIQGNINGKFNNINKKFVLSNIYINDLQGNQFFSNKIDIFYVKNKYEKIKCYKTFIRLNYSKIRKIISYNNYNLFMNFIKKRLNNQWITYEGNLILKKRNLQVEGIIHNYFIKAKILAFINFLNNDIQYTGKIFLKKKYLYFSFKKKNVLSIDINKYFSTKKNENIFINFKGNTKCISTSLFFFPYKISLEGKIDDTNFHKISININNTTSRYNEPIIKAILINNQSFKKIDINIYNMLIGHVHGYFQWKYLVNIMKRIFFLKNFCHKQIKYINFNFLIKKSFFDFLEHKKHRNIFSDIQISGKKENNVFKMFVFTKLIRFHKFFLEKPFIIINSSLKKKVHLYIEKMIYKNFFQKKIDISLLNEDNSYMINSKFFLKTKKGYQEQILNLVCKKDRNYFTFYPLYSSKFNINEYDWKINNFGKIKVDFIHQKYTIDHLIFYSGKQKIIINIDFINNKNQIFQFYLQNVQLKKIFFKKNLDGLINGIISCKYINNQIEPNIHIAIEKLSINDNPLGNFYVYSFIQQKNNYKIYGILKNNSHELVKVDGNINNKLRNKSKLNFKIHIKNLNMDNFSFLWKKMNSEVKGIITGNIQVFGNLYEPNYFGKLKITKFGIKINSTNTYYEMTSPFYINIFSKSCTLSPSSFIEKKYHTKGFVHGFLLHKNFLKWDLNLSIQTKNLLVLNTNDKQNPFLFGKIFICGKIQMTKKENKIHICMKNGKILNFSHLYFNPFGLKLKQKEKVVKEKNDFLFVDIKTNINKNTKVSIFLDKDLKNFIELRGEGPLFLKKTSKENMKTSGKYFVISGLYHFSNQKKIPILRLELEKEFKIKPGGFIIWNNNFYQSNVHVIAYETKYVSNAIEYIKKKYSKSNFIFTELRMIFSGKTQKPEINIEILFPKSNKETQQKLLNKLNSLEEQTIQFFSVLILGKFFIKSNFIKNLFYERTIRKISKNFMKINKKY
ncbi:translocation/assembly module TamB domain-containing protein [Blattabacterium cuenoti]|uniref:translocation/assembly module TamB domain-containing protein n=1 Tax=Blattabacterium cuenoti TaxID=1653831 RepID=UPI00163C6A6D|nr:translocation/assembly module TamB domain-containing protein [Blattabacterium cuenoti]